MFNMAPTPAPMPAERLKTALRAGTGYSALPRAVAALNGTLQPDLHRQDRSVSMLRDPWLHLIDDWAKAKVWHSYAKAYTAAQADRFGGYLEHPDRDLNPAKWRATLSALQQVAFDALGTAKHDRPRLQWASDYWHAQRVCAAFKWNWKA